MEYYYFGYEKQILISLDRYAIENIAEINELVIKDNIDGLPLYKSSSTCIWPLLAKIDNLKPSVVFPVLVTIGRSKPKDLDFLKEAVSEINTLENEGILYNGKRLRVCFSAHICDTPARNMVKATVAFNAYHGCDFCEEKGTYDGKRMIWPSTRNLVHRTNESFRDKHQPSHHRSYLSPFELSECDMVLGFPIDFMHQGCGVILRLLKWNVQPFPNDHVKRHCRMSASNISLLNSRLNALRTFIPNCFSRLPRSTREINRFKATELRQVLLYTSTIIFKGLMASDLHYHHLCTLNAGCRLLVDPVTARTENVTAARLLTSFCEEAKTLYGTGFIVYNVHCLLHLPRIAMTHGSLDAVSAYNFENYLRILKLSVRSAKNPIISCIKNVYERQRADKSNILTVSTPVIYTKHPNNCYIDLHRKKCYQVVEITVDGVLLREYKTFPYFRKPISSDLIGCFKAKNDQYNYVTLDETEVIDMRRAMRIDLRQIPGFDEKDVSVFIAMLHEGHDLFP